MSMYTLVPFGQSVLRCDHVLLPARFRPFGALVIGIAYRGRKEGLFLPVPFRQERPSVRVTPPGDWLTPNIGLSVA